MTVRRAFLYLILLFFIFRIVQYWVVVYPREQREIAEEEKRHKEWCAKSKFNDPLIEQFRKDYTSCGDQDEN